MRPELVVEVVIDALAESAHTCQLPLPFLGQLVGVLLGPRTQQRRLIVLFLVSLQLSPRNALVVSVLPPSLALVGTRRRQIGLMV
jgi:hypothetical protein